MFSRLSRKEWNWVYGLAALAFVSRVVLALRGEAVIASRPYIEDAYYVLTVSRQLALGHGLSADGIHPTNGVQPIITILYAPFFLITSDRWLAVRLTFLLAGVIVAAGTIAIAILVASIRKTEQPLRSSSPLLAAALWAFTLPSLLQNTNGLETGLVSSLLLITLWVFCKPQTNERALSWIGFGVLLGILVLTRIDTVFAVAAFALTDLIRHGYKAFARVLIYCFTCLLVSSPWWYYNLGTFHSLMPISGQQESLGSWTGLNIQFAGASFFDFLTVFYHHSAINWGPLTTFACLAVVLAVWILIIIRTGLHHKIRTHFDLMPLMPLIVFGVALTIYYVFFFGAPYMMDRFLNPIRLLCIILVSIGAPSIVSSVSGRLRKHRAMQLAMAALGGIVIFYTAAHYEGLLLRPNPWVDFYRMGQWAAVQPEKIGMSQSGIAGFMASNVVNLDGKVNADALMAIREHRMVEYVDHTGIRYLADWEDALAPLVKEAHSKGIEFSWAGAIGHIRIYERRP